MPRGAVRKKVRHRGGTRICQTRCKMVDSPNGDPKDPPPHSSWLHKVLPRIRELGAARRVRFTYKARRELASQGGGLDEEDACDVLANLTASESAGRARSGASGEWLYTFKPVVAGAVVYVKLVLRGECVVISFHEDEESDHEEGGS